MSDHKDWDSEREFPMDWDDWWREWASWYRYHQDALRPSSFRFPPKSFLADEVLGVWRIGHRTVELSEVVFLGHRGIGITYGTAAGTEVPADGGVVHSFRELEERLAADCGVTFGEWVCDNYAPDPDDVCLNCGTLPSDHEKG